MAPRRMASSVATRGGSTGAAEPYVNGQWQLTAHLIIYLRNVAAVLRANEDVVVFGGCTLASHISEFYDPIHRHPDYGQ